MLCSGPKRRVKSTSGTHLSESSSSRVQADHPLPNGAVLSVSLLLAPHPFGTFVFVFFLQRHAKLTSRTIVCTMYSGTLIIRYVQSPCLGKVPCTLINRENVPPNLPEYALDARGGTRTRMISISPTNSLLAGDPFLAARPMRQIEMQFDYSILQTASICIGFNEIAFHIVCRNWYNAMSGRQLLQFCTCFFVHQRPVVRHSPIL